MSIFIIEKRYDFYDSGEMPCHEWIIHSEAGYFTDKKSADAYVLKQALDAQSKSHASELKKLAGKKKQAQELLKILNGYLEETSYVDWYKNSEVRIFKSTDRPHLAWFGSKNVPSISMECDEYFIPIFDTRTCIKDKCYVSIIEEDFDKLKKVIMKVLETQTSDVCEPLENFTSEWRIVELEPHK